jgi:hypothetical protein
MLSEGLVEPADLPALIRKIARANASEASPGRLADQVLAEIPPGQERALLAKLLPGYVGEVLRRVDSTPADSVDPNAPWNGLLHDRVPTADGYRFLADCTAEDISAGAERRRRLAENLAARAEVYEAVANAMTAQGVETAHELDTDTGRELATRPTSDPLIEAAELDAADLRRRLLDDPRLLRTATFAHARDNIPSAVAEALEQDDVRNAWHSMIQKLLAYLSHPKPWPGTQRSADVDGLWRDRQAVRAPGVQLTGAAGDTVAQLLALPSERQRERLLKNRYVLEQAVLFEARMKGKAPAALMALIREPEMLPHAITALETLHQNLNHHIARLKEQGEYVSKRAMDDRSAVARRARHLRQDYDRVRSTVPERQKPIFDNPFNNWERAVLSERKEQHYARLDELQEEYGCTPTLRMPKQGVIAWAIDHNLLPEPDPEVARIAALDDEQLRDLVGEDANASRPCVQLREDVLLDRWRAALLELKDVTLERIAAAVDEDEIRRRRRFEQAIDTRLGEQRRLLLVARDRIHDQVEARDEDAELRQELWIMAGREVIAQKRTEIFSS